MLLTVSTFVFITYPLLRRKTVSTDSNYSDKLRELNTKRDTAYSMLKELEFDFHSGILSEEDYRELEKRYKQKAVTILKDVDKLKKGTDIDAEIEKQVAELRQRKDRFCSHCGERCQEGDLFCSQCGTKINTRGEL
jgi:hypothetical protein